MAHCPLPAQNPAAVLQGAPEHLEARPSRNRGSLGVRQMGPVILDFKLLRRGREQRNSVFCHCDGSCQVFLCPLCYSCCVGEGT